MNLNLNKTLIVYIVILSLSLSSTLINALRIEEKVCIGTNGRMSVPANREHHYRNLRDRYTNCTYVDGNLELTWLQDEKLDLSFLQHIREVTGYVLISHVDVTRIILPSLQIIRGRTLFKLNVHDDEFALIVTLSKMHNLELPALRDILEGSVGILNNYNLCHIKTIEWNEIITGQNAKYLYVYKFQEKERDCTPCHETCDRGCWGEGSNNCQKFSKINCSPQCHQGRCFGSQPRECCHLFCAGGCTGPKQSDCLACRNFYDDGVCKQECPPMQRYNPIKYKWEKNPNGKYAYGATCVRDCPKHLLKDNGACVRVCPSNKKTVDGECVPCNGPCPKTCHFSEIIHAGNIEKLKNCTVIEGSITILDSSFDGFQQIYDNFTFGPRYPAMDPSRLVALSSLKEVTGFLNIQAHHPNFTSLDAFRNLETIGGRQMTEYFSALYIVKTSLISLNMRSLREIRSGSVAILENQELCYAQNINWKQIMKSSSHNTLLQNNRPPQKCIPESKICDTQCAESGCWGPGKGMCLSCKHYTVENECVGSCDPNLGLYQSSESKCMKCHAECELTCTGREADSCDACKHTKDGPFCVKECPDGKYNANGECLPCHKNCIGGCKGPENTVSPTGCNSCEKVIIDANFNVDQCLPAKQDCPDGFYLDWVSRQAASSNEMLDNLEMEGKAICRPCHPLCKRCTAYGFHKEVCLECHSLQQQDQCTEECSANHYIGSNRNCLPCHSECRESCRGPTSYDCNSCMNFRVFADEHAGNLSNFSCTNECPKEFPHKVYNSEEEGHKEPYCSKLASAELIRGEKNTEGMVIGVIVAIVILGVLLALGITYQYRRRSEKKKAVNDIAKAMLNTEDHIPLRNTNVKPNLSQIHIISEHELIQGDVLGCGAFGAVHKGFWHIRDTDSKPPNDVKIPVAIKLLHDCDGANSSNAILEEAKIMASIEHPNLLKLLAISMTSRLMLVTQLMPLGCLLSYVRKNKDNIGSKHLLNWCVQIAKGMAYLEEKRLVHRDLAARNVLVQKPDKVKITDFGLAKLLDVNESEYKAQGGKMPIKWLAIECIRKKVFTHKSDVWAYGVTVWELLTQGETPYKNYKAEHVPDILEKGERLSQPPFATIDIYMFLVKCWVVEPDSRPSFKVLVDEFTRMARDPGRYLVIPGDKLMRLPEFTPQDEKELIRSHVTQSGLGGSLDGVIGAEEYFNPNGRMSSQHTLNTPVDTPVPPATPSQKFFPPGMTLPSDMSHRNSQILNGNSRHSRYGSQQIPEGFSTLGSRSRHSSMFPATQQMGSCNILEDGVDGSGMLSSLTDHNTMFSQRSVMTNGGSTMHSYPRPPTRLPVDDEGYLEPSPKSPPTSKDNHTPTGNNAYMDLLSDPVTAFQYPPPQIFLTDNPSNYGGRVPDLGNGGQLRPSIDNLEYILTSNTSNSGHGSRGNYHELGIPLVSSANNGSPASSQGPSSIHSVTSNPPNSGKPPSLTSNGSSSGGTRSAGLNGVMSTKNSGPENSSNHEYYNDYDRFKNLQPLKLQPPPAKHETTV